MPFGGIEADGGDLRAGGLFHRGAVVFQLGFAGRVDSMGEIADVALGFQGLPIDRHACRGEHPEQDAHPQTVSHP